ncbi:MAG: CHASE2 domain-containing protein [Rhodospirillales bacterium]
MTDTAGDARAARGLRWREALWACGLTVGVALAVASAARLGWLQSLELAAYDRLGAAIFADLGPEKRVTLIAIDEPAIKALGWPLSDETAAELLERVLAAGPRAVGLDLYRDQPRPPGTERLAALLALDRRLVGAMFVADSSGNRVPPPPALAGTGRAAAADMPLDADALVRRGLLYRDDGNDTVPSLALTLASTYLAADGIAPRASPANPDHMVLGRAAYRPLETDDGGYAGVDAGGYQYLLDYGRRQTRIPAVAISEVLAGTADPALFRDCAVLAGVVAPSAKDFFRASAGAEAWIGRELIYGPELQAAALAQLLRQAKGVTVPTRVLPPRVEAAWVVGWCALGGLAGVFVAGPLVIALALIGGLLALSGAAAAALWADWWLPPAAPALGWIGALGAVSGRRLMLQFRQKAQLQRMFARFVDPGVADLLWKQRDVYLSGGRPRPLRFQATVLMSDLAGFSAASEKLDPAQVMEWVGVYMDRMTDLVLDRGGMVEKFAGDGILAVFGSPADGEDMAAAAVNARHAVECALAMNPAIAALNEAHARNGLPLQKTRVGIHSGPMVAGTVGSARRSQYTVLGDTPNVAARLESFDKEKADFGGRDGWCRTLLSGSTAELIGPAYVLEKWADTPVRGRAGMLAIFRLAGKA